MLLPKQLYFTCFYFYMKGLTFSSYLNQNHNVFKNDDCSLKFKFLFILPEIAQAKQMYSEKAIKLSN